MFNKNFLKGQTRPAATTTPSSYSNKVSKVSPDDAENVNTALPKDSPSSNRSPLEPLDVPISTADVIAQTKHQIPFLNKKVTFLFFKKNFV